MYLSLSLSQDLATPSAFARSPSLVWEFYHYRRELMLTKNPNPAHTAIAECEARLAKQASLPAVLCQDVFEASAVLKTRLVCFSPIKTLIH